MFPSSMEVEIQRRKNLSCFSELVVGAPGFEPGASCAQGRRATRLRYAPTSTAPSILKHFPHLLQSNTNLHRIYGKFDFFNCTPRRAFPRLAHGNCERLPRLTLEITSH